MFVRLDKCPEYITASRHQRLLQEIQVIDFITPSTLRDHVDLIYLIYYEGSKHITYMQQVVPSSAILLDRMTDGGQWSGQ